MSRCRRRGTCKRSLNKILTRFPAELLSFIFQKYNSTLETLDLSRNPCSGPGLEGVRHRLSLLIRVFPDPCASLTQIQSLRTAFTLNTALKRLFLSSTSMTSDGAIALAEFLPESTSLLHLDLTMNNLDIAGVMALSSGLKANHTMRCLDLNIPPGDEEFARYVFVYVAYGFLLC